MTELIWLNGKVSPLSEARISVEDRGFQFADGVYEVIRVYRGTAFTLREHLDRLERSARGIELDLPMAVEPLCREIEALVERSGLREGMVYLQLTEGTAFSLGPLTPVFIALVAFLVLSTILSVQNLRRLGNLRFVVAVGLVVMGPLLLVWL